MQENSGADDSLELVLALPRPGRCLQQALSFMALSGVLSDSQSLGISGLQFP